MGMAATGATLPSTPIAQIANGPKILAGRPCGFSCRARCRWASFRKVSGTHSSASRPSTICAARPVGVSRVIKGAPSARNVLTGSSQQLLKDPDVDPVGNTIPLSKAAVEQLRGLSWWLNVAIVTTVAVTAGNELVVHLGVTPDWSPLQTVQQGIGTGWNLYAQQLSRSPVLTKAVISAGTFLLADLSAQSQEGRDYATLDGKRMLRCAAVGLLLHGPMCHVFFGKLDRELIISKYFRGGDAWFAPFAKVLVDQTAWSAAWNTTYLVAIGLLNGRGVGRTLGSVWRSAGTLVKSGWRLWPLANLVTYTLIPLQHRVLWVDTVELVWASVLSMHGSHERQRSIAQAQLTQPTPAPHKARPSVHIRKHLR